MKLPFIFLISILFSGQSLAQICNGNKAVLIEEGICNTNEWQLVFEDNFESLNLDTGKWAIPYQGVIRDFEFKKEKQWYANSGASPAIDFNHNIEFSDGNLKIISRQEISPINGAYVSNFDVVPWKVESQIFNYSSAQIASKSPFGYGKYEIKCKIPKGRGFWPAFWLYGVNGNNASEIDIFEFWDDNTFNHNMNVHFNHKMCLTDYNSNDFSDNFHVFTLIWDNYKIEWYVDGILKRRNAKFNTITGQQLDCEQLRKDQIYIVDKNFPIENVNIILNLAIQNDEYKPNGTTNFPGIFEIDYVRYYSK
jgi:beta-glucanase (GH16 family)